MTAMHATVFKGRVSQEALEYALLETVRLLLIDGNESEPEIPGINYTASEDSDAYCSRPAPRAKRPAASKVTGTLGGPCAHCGATDSPQWRRPVAKKVVLCNACGIYYSRHQALPKRKKLPTSKAAARLAADSEPEDVPGHANEVKDEEPTTRAWARGSACKADTRGSVDYLQPEEALACGSSSPTHSSCELPLVAAAPPTPQKHSGAGVTPYKRGSARDADVAFSDVPPAKRVAVAADCSAVASVWSTMAVSMHQQQQPAVPIVFPAAAKPALSEHSADSGCAAIILIPMTTCRGPRVGAGLRAGALGK